MEVVLGDLSDGSREEGDFGGTVDEGDCCFLSHGLVDDEEVASEMDMDLEQFYQVKRMSSISFISFEEIGYTSNDEKEFLLSHLISGTREDALTLTTLKEIKATIAKAIDTLPEKERLVISMYYSDELTMKEIGKVLSITESRVSQIHTQAIIHLRAKLRREGLIED